MATETLSPAHFVRIEAAALEELAVRLERDSVPGGPLDRALNLLDTCSGSGHRVVVTGMGKSGIIARKIASTFCSIGVPAQFLHPTEAVHGDLGAVAPGDVAIVLSYSGETEEVLRLLPAFERLGSPIVALTGDRSSTLARASAVALDVSVTVEACPLNLAPTASTTVMLALGDALALELSRRRGFDPQGFADLHPGGALGRRLARVCDLMHAGEDLPSVELATPMPRVIYEMSRKKLGMTVVLDANRGLAGMISDGDLRRLLERDGAHALQKTAGQVMNAAPSTVSSDAFAAEALELMERRKITSLIVVDKTPSQVLGVVHLHDLFEVGPARG